MIFKSIPKLSNKSCETHPKIMYENIEDIRPNTTSVQIGSRRTIYFKSADRSGLRVDRPPFFQSLFSPILLFLIRRTSFLSEPLILLTLRAQGEVYLPDIPPPWPRIGNPRMVLVVSAELFL